MPSTGDPFPYVHFFFRMQDGSTIAFFEAVGLPASTEPTHPAYLVFDHLALEVGTQAEVDEWRDRLVAHEVDVIGPINHGIIYSVYFHDPNGIRLEITTPLAADWNDRPEVARDIVGILARGQARGAGQRQARRRGAAAGHRRPRLSRVSREPSAWSQGRRSTTPRLRIVLMRGGTSKGVFVRDGDLPAAGPGPGPAAAPADGQP